MKKMKMDKSNLCQKILLVNPPWRVYEKSNKTLGGLPLGIMYIASTLKKEGYAVKVLDALCPDIQFKKDTYTHVGMSWEDIAKIIREYNPDFVGISSQFTSQVDNVIEIAKLVKSINPKIKVIVGGPHPSAFPSDFIKRMEFDYIVQGEGEYVLMDIINKKIRKKLIKAKIITALDALPFPAYDLVDMKRYINTKIKHHDSTIAGGIPFITSRGCPYDCVFCSIKLCMGSVWRSHSAEYVISHLKHLVENYGVRGVHFEDDNFTLDINRTYKILHGIIDNNLKISWDTPNGVRADRLNENLIKLMKQSGCVELRVSPESGSQRVINKIIGKNLKLSTVEDVAFWCKKYGIRLVAFFVYGLPGETKEEIKKTFLYGEYLRDKYGVTPSFAIATPLIGTRLYKICKQRGYLIKEPTYQDYATGTKIGLIQTDEFSPKYLEEIMREYHRRYYKKHPLNLLMELIKKPKLFKSIIKVR